MGFTDFWSIRPQPRPDAVLKGDGWRITVLTDRLLRLEYAADNRFRDCASTAAINRDFPVPAFEVRQEGGRLILETEAIRLEYDQQPFSPDGLFAVMKGQYLNHGSIWRFGEEPYNLKGTARTLDQADGAVIRSMASPREERPLPMEKGLMSVDGFAVLDDSRSMSLDGNGELLPAQPHGADLYLFAYGWDFKGALKDFYHLSGPVPVLPRYALGNWWSRYYKYTEKSYKALIHRFAEEKVPLSVAVIDMNWHVTDIDPKYGTGWTGYTWDPAMFPDPEAMLRWLHEKGLRVTLNDHPADGIRGYETLYPAMARAMGIDPATEKPVVFDASSREFLEAYEKVVLDSFDKTGVDFWWVDWQQRGGTSRPGVDPLFVLNHTRWLYANRRDSVGMTFSRYGGPGSHRYPIGFSGDTCITWDSLAFQPYFTATASNIGYGWWSHDIGGHMLGVRDEELAVRWLQFGVFSPILRLHSSMSEFLSKEPWSFPPEACQVMENFLRLRHRLVPWLYTRAVRASEEGSTILYPVYYDWPLGWNLFRVERNEYVFGGEMLVAPITRPADRATGLGCADVWLPEGEWVDFFSGRRYRGGMSLKAYRPLSGIPVFVRPGAVLPMDGGAEPENGCPLPRTLLFRVFAGKSGSGTVTEDNGLHPGTKGYRRCDTTLSYAEGEDVTVRLNPPEGDASLIPGDRRVTVELVGMENRLPDEVSCACESAYDPETRTLRLALSAPVGEGATLKWHTRPGRPPTDRAGQVYRLLLNTRMANKDKDAMLETARTVPEPAGRLAAWMALDPPPALIGALTELECTD